MTITVMDWRNELFRANMDEKVGISIATLFESNGKGTYVTSLSPGSSVKPHYHQNGDEEYHIVSGSGIIRLLPVNYLENDFEFVCKDVQAQNSFIISPNVIHQLINNGTEQLILIFSCPLSHLKEDRIVMESVE